MKIGEDFHLGSDGRLTFGEGIQFSEPDVRDLRDALPVVLDPAADPNHDRSLYYMYRGVYKKSDWETFLNQNIRYDLTVLLPGMIGREYIKTVGHFHPHKPQSQETYPEYYEVLYGEALYLLQKNSRSGDVEEILAVEAKKGDKVYIPSGYGHVTINGGDTCLVMANLIESNFSSLYEAFREKRGAAYYYIQGGSGRPEFIRNENYRNSVGLKVMAAPGLGHPTDVVKGKSLYEAFLLGPEIFSFLK